MTIKEKVPTLSQATTSWTYELTRGGKDPTKSTARLYLTILKSFADFLAQDGHADPIISDISRDDIRRWEAHRAQTGHGRTGGPISPTTLNLEHRALRSFFTFVTAEQDLDSHPMSNISPPKAAVPEVHVLTDEEYARLLAKVVAKTFEGRRNEAVLRFLWATGCRLGETTGLTTDDLDLAEKVAHVDGKTGPRYVPFDNDARRALDRYLRIRASHPQATDKQRALWLGPKGPLSESGVYQIVRDASRAAGVPAFPHMFRHTSAHRQLAAGMGEQNVQTAHGWSTSRMLTRYGASRKQDRMIDDYRKKLDR
jgi:site-specific recombinase XerD